MRPAFLSSFLPSLLFSVSVFGTRKEGRKGGRRGEKVVRRAEEIKKCYRVCGCGGVDQSAAMSARAAAA